MLLTLSHCVIDLLQWRMTLSAYAPNGIEFSRILSQELLFDRHTDQPTSLVSTCLS